MYLVTTETIAGKELEYLGMVQGSMIQSAHAGKDLMAGLKTLFGGEPKSYTGMMKKAREIAARRMAAEAQMLGADAVINVRFTASSVMQGAAEILAYGTAVKIKKDMK